MENINRNFCDIKLYRYIIYEKFCDKESKEWDPMEGSNGMLVERSILGNFCDNKTQKYLDST